MTHLHELDDKTFSKIKTGDINFLLLRQDEKKPFKEADKVIIQSGTQEGTLTITNVVNDEPRGLMKNYCIISFKAEDA